MEKAEALFRSTNDLRGLITGAAFFEDPELRTSARYLGGPPLSADDLRTFTGISPGRKRISREDAKIVAGVITAALDRDRFPWLFGRSRSPTATEREVALKWTAGLQAAQRVQTRRRGESSARQEAAVERLLTSLRFRKVEAKPVDVTTDFGRGRFSRETRVGGAKCDIPIGLRDGRVLFLECKVSNSAVNSVKRLNRETVGKALAWAEVFGQRAITGAVLAGVYKLANLESAQRSGVVIFWEHDREPLKAFLLAAR
jgi:hypothetical protein